MLWDTGYYFKYLFQLAFSDTTLGGEGGPLFCDFQVGLEVWVLHFASVDTEMGGSSLCACQGGSSDIPLDLQWEFWEGRGWKSTSLPLPLWPPYPGPLGKANLSNRPFGHHPSRWRRGTLLLPGRVEVWLPAQPLLVWERMGPQFVLWCWPQQRGCCLKLFCLGRLSLYWMLD